MKFALITAEKAQYPIGALCSILDVSRSGFYDWSARALSARAREDEKLKVHIAAIFERYEGRYG